MTYRYGLEDGDVKPIEKQLLEYNEMVQEHLTKDDAQIEKEKKQHIKPIELKQEEWEGNQNEEEDNRIKINNFIANARLFYKLQPYFYDKNQIWWIWNNFKWEVTDDVDMSKLLDKKLGFRGQTVTSSIRNNHLEAMRWIGREKKPKDAQLSWIQFKDVVFDIKTKDIFPASPEYFFTNPIPWKLGDKEDTPTIDKLFTEWVGEENKKSLYEIIAYCCYRDYPIHIIISLFGSGRNGKTQFQRLNGIFLGQENICTTELDLLLDNRFETFKLYKKLSCQMGETNFGIINKTSMLKKLSGQDMVGFEKKGKTPFDDCNYAKILINSNSLPTSEDTSEGFYRRWMIIDFPNSFPEGKDIIQTIPLSEYENLCRKVVNILPEMLERGNFTNQGSIESRKDKYINSSNPFSIFVNIFCEKDHNESVEYSKLYSKYVEYLISNKRRIVSKKEFSQVIERDGFEIVKKTVSDGESRTTKNYVYGIKFRVAYQSYL